MSREDVPRPRSGCLQEKGELKAVCGGSILPGERLLGEKIECDALCRRRDAVDILTKDFLASGARLGQNSRFEVEIWSATARDHFCTNLSQPHLPPPSHASSIEGVLSVKVDHQCSPIQNGHGEKGLLIGPITCKSDDAWLS